MSKNAHFYFQPSGHHGVPINGTQVINVKRIKTMIRDFSLVFLLLISDCRNMHRDSRRDTEQNVPWLVDVVLILHVSLTTKITVTLFTIISTYSPLAAEKSGGTIDRVTTD